MSDAAASDMVVLLFRKADIMQIADCGCVLADSHRHNSIAFSQYDGPHC